MIPNGQFSAEDQIFIFRNYKIVEDNDNEKLSRISVQNLLN